VPRLPRALSIFFTASLSLIFVIGCAPEPFAPTPLPILNHPDPFALRNNFAATIPPHFISDDSVIIYAPFHRLAVLGVLRVDRPAGAFELAGLNQIGVQIFEIGGDRNGNIVRFAIPPLDQQREILLSIAADVRRIYFDLLPADGAMADVRPTFVRFRQPAEHGTLIYEFGGAPSFLLEKRFAGWLGTIWRVRYFDYASSNGTLYPRGVVMDNAKYHYRIVIKNRDWQTQ
jgi:hypothetical protein